jgi:hypothetical protein
MQDVIAALKAMDRARLTPIVDDDFPALIAEADRRLAAMLARFKGFPKVVCLCGSTRFKAAWYETTKRLTHEGCIVLGVGDLNPNKPDTNDPIDPDLKARLDALHLRKIDLADEVLILNVGGYVGESTAREMAHARKIGKPVRFLEERVEVMA